MKIPKGMLGKIAVVRMWPGIDTAEDEVIARLQNTCKILGIEVVVIDTNGHVINEAEKEISFKEVDFVIHLHFETPKTYDAYSFVALWNPLDFYFQWGYRRHSKNLMTHDDFLSCGSKTADDQVRRFIDAGSLHQSNFLTMYHSLPGPYMQPTTGQNKLFYVGINWERLGGGIGRHDDLLKTLDKSNDLVIYGPKLFQGVDVWEGFESYQGTIPFDGSSIINEIHNAGVALVLSSEAHKKSQLMSSRLFEGLAAGAVIIVDENPFARSHFGDTLLYIKTENIPPEEITNQVKMHLEWIKNNQREAVKLASRAQEIFKNKFDMLVSIEEIYSNLIERKNNVKSNLCSIQNKIKVHIFSVFYSFSLDELSCVIENFSKQSYENKFLYLFFDEYDFKENSQRINNIMTNFDLAEVSVQKILIRDQDNRIVKKVNLGSIIFPKIDMLPNNELFTVLPSHEFVFSDHFSSLVRSFENNQDLDVSYSDVLIRHEHNEKLYTDLVTELCPFNDLLNFPNGFSRFLFKKHSSINYDRFVPYLGFGIFDALFVKARSKMRVPRASSRISLSSLPYLNLKDYHNDYEIILDTLSEHEINEFKRNWVSIKKGFHDQSVSKNLADYYYSGNFKLNQLNIESRREIIAHLIEALSLPNFLIKLIRKIHLLIGKK